jgi:glucose-6-phosphate 1-dehydrogenase
MAQNLIVFRAGNSLIKETWNKDFIESIEIYAAEVIGIEGRAYEQAGALRDVVQSHLLQLAALVLMDLSDVAAAHDIAAKRLRALEALVAPRDVFADVVRGQYEGYRAEVKNSSSAVETYVSLRLYSRDPRWEGVPITLTTGKALDIKTTEIRIHYRQKDAAHANQLVLRIHPDEGLTLHFWVKRPGYDYDMQPLPLVLAYGNHFAGLPDAYERVFVDAMRAEHALFATSREVLASWRLLEPIQKAWNASDSKDLLIYKRGQRPLA